MAKILILDDDLRIRNAYSFILSRRGHTVFESGDAVQAMQLFAQHIFDYVFADMNMPDVDGIKFLKSIAKLPHRDRCKVFALSNSESPATIKQAHKLGIYRYLVKVDYSPYGLAEIVENEESRLV